MTYVSETDTRVPSNTNPAYIPNDHSDLARLERTNMVTRAEDRIKVDLVEMSKYVLENLRSCTVLSGQASREVLNKLLVQFNQGALVQYQYGEVERAEQLCRAAIEMFAGFSTQTGVRHLCFGNMIPPYINLARISGQRGDVEASLQIFDDISQFGRERQDLSVLSYDIPVADAQLIMSEGPSLLKLMLSCSVIEKARVLQTCENHQALLALAETVSELAEYQDAFYQQYTCELRCRALLALRQYEDALAAAMECYKRMPPNTLERIAILPVISQVYRESGLLDMAEATLNKLEETIRALEGRRISALRQLAYRLALERYALQDEIRALEAAENAFRWCREWKDQPGAIKSCILVVRVLNHMLDQENRRTEARHWCQVLHQQAAMSYFRVERACAYWELGITAAVGEGGAPERADELLQGSYCLYQSISLLDAHRHAESLKRLLETRGVEPEESLMKEELASAHNSLIDSVFDALIDKTLALGRC